MVRTEKRQHANSQHTLLTDAWTADVQGLEKGIASFGARAGHANTYHVSLFEMAGDPRLHVNVTHRHETARVMGWAGPGESAAGFIHNRRFESMPTETILRSIREMVFAPRVDARRSAGRS